MPPAFLLRDARKTAGVVELVAGSLFQEACLQFAQFAILLVCLQHGIVGWKQAVVESLDHTHGQDHQTIFVGLKRTEKGVGRIPNQVCVFLGSAAHLVQKNMKEFWVMRIL